MDKKDLEKLDTYFLENIGVDSTKVAGYQAVLKKDVKVIMNVDPVNYAHTIHYPIIINKGTKIKIIGPSVGGEFQSLGYNTHLGFEIVNPQVRMGKLWVEDMKTLIKAIKIRKK